MDVTYGVKPTAARVAQLPDGVRLRPLVTHPDHRGTFTEIFREEWDTGVRPIQWNAVASEARTLRGVHVHDRHTDYLVLLRGRASIGLMDLRPGSPTMGWSGMVESSREQLQALVIPPGVAHGFYFPQPSLHLYSTSEYWDPPRELGCRWDDPALGLRWPDDDPVVSIRDAGLGSLSELSEALAGRWPPSSPADVPRGAC